MMREHGDKLDMDVLNSMDTLHLNIQVRRRQCLRASRRGSTQEPRIATLWQVGKASIRPSSS